MGHIHFDSIYTDIDSLPPFVKDGLKDYSYTSDDDEIVEQWHSLNSASREDVIEELEGNYSIACCDEEGTDELRLILLLNRISG